METPHLQEGSGELEELEGAGRLRVFPLQRVRPHAVPLWPRQQLALRPSRRLLVQRLDALEDPLRSTAQRRRQITFDSPGIG